MAFQGVAYFTRVYPDKVTVYSILNAFITIFAGIISSYVGSYFGDYYETDKGGNKYYMKGVISAIGAFLGGITSIFCFII